MSNPFLSLRASALNNPASFPAILMDEEFVERVQFKGEKADEDRVAVQLALLKRVALDPRRVALGRTCLNRGTVHLEFFGVTNPIPLFMLPLGSPLLQRLKVAVEENVQSRMFNAAERVLKWQWKQHWRHEDALVNQLKRTLVWPDREAYAKFPEDAAKAYQENLKALNQRREEIRARRQARMGKLAKAAAPGLQYWTQLLQDISLEVFADQAATLQ